MTTDSSRSARLADVYRHASTSELAAELGYREAGKTKEAARVAAEIRSVLDYRLARSAFAL